MNTFTQIVADLQGRKWRLTFNRAGKGTFPKRIKIERLQGNGRDMFWTLYRESCHGKIANHTLEAFAQAAHNVRFQ